MEAQHLDALPELNQGLFPIIPSPGNYMLQGKVPWNVWEMEHTAAFLVSAISNHKRWVAVPLTDFLDVVNQDPIRSLILRDTITHWLSKFISSGDIELIKVKGTFYLIPTKSFGEKLKACSLMPISEVQIQIF